MPEDYHYENMPIQIYWKFYHKKKKKTEKNSDKKDLIFFIFLLETKITIHVRTALARQFYNSNDYPQSMFLSRRNKKYNVYPCKPQFLLYKSGV